MNARRGPDKTTSVVMGPITPIADPSELTGNTINPHCFVGIRFYADAGGTTPAVPTAGTVAIEIATVNNSPNFEDPPQPTIDAADPMTVSWAANTQTVHATPAGIDVATHYQMVATFNET